MSISPQSIIVIPDTQEDYIIYDREITENPDPQFNHNILVTKDNLSNRLYFNMWYTFDDVELVDKEICIVWKNANNEKGITLCTEKQVIDDRLIFAWDVPVEVTYVAGVVNFSVRITTKNYIWNSLIGHVTVQQGLPVDEVVPAVAPAGWISYIQTKYSTNMESLSKSDYDNLDVKNTNTLYIVTDWDDSVSLYLGDKLVTLPITYFDTVKDITEGTSTNLNIPKGITKIANGPFSNNSYISVVTLPNTVTTIDNYAFQNSNLASITIGTGITTIGASAFDSCSRLTDIYFLLPEDQQQIVVPADNWGAPNATLHWLGR